MFCQFLKKSNIELQYMAKIPPQIGTQEKCKYRYTCYTIITHKSQKVQTTQKSIKSWMAK